MKKLKHPFTMKFLRGVLTPALASVALLSGSAMAQQEPPPEEEPKYEEVILEEGNGWQLKHIKGTALDERTKTYQPYEEKVFTLTPKGLYEAPLAGGVREELIADAREETDVFTLNQRILEEIDISEKQGFLTPALKELAQPADEVPPDEKSSGIERNGYTQFGSCSDQIHTRSKSLNINTPLNWSGNLGGGFSGSLSASGNLSGSATGEVQFAIKRKKVLWWCVPYGAKFNHAHVWGNASVAYGANVNGNLSYNWAWQTQIAKPSLGSLSFWIGPVPVYIGFNLPINLGMDVQASVTGNLTYNGSQTATGSFNYTCTLSGCSGSSSYNLGGNTQNTLTGSVSGRVYPNVWVQVAVRAYLYDEWLAYAQIGVRPYLRGDLWGYYGNACGDADQNGANETVSALTFDLDWQLYLTGEARAFGNSPTQWNNLWSTPRRHIKFWDLIGSSALRPMTSGPASTTVGTSTAYSARMRPCWPYSDQMGYRFDWGDASTTTFNGAAHAWNASSHAWAAPGTKTLSLTAQSDTHGRTLNQTTTRGVKVVGWTPWLNRDAPGGVGDYETLSDFLAAGQACSNPTAIECRTTGGVLWNQTGQVYSCTLSGGACQNSNQSNGQCLDYMVRFYCP
ncbi:hypothetical protein [Hyalangium gracile]|uniref:hypothetical protein n=1 Tax=Hyalangium gracile TaxID=394092 RepID=UPI001CCD9CF5|nr:hypothetical protein [Hyalangium gracile]